MADRQPDGGVMERPSDLDPVRIRTIAATGIAVIEAGQEASGAYIAAPSFTMYRYCWLRDGAFIADAMSRMGRVESAEAFFSWCAQVVEQRRGRIDALLARAARGEAIGHEEFLPTRYHADGTESTEEWTDFQLDGYGAWIWALDAHRRRHGRSVDRWLGGVTLSARYIATFWDHPSYDWWEEHREHIHSSTLAAIYGGLRAAASLAPEPGEREGLSVAAARVRAAIRGDAASRGYVGKWLGSDAVDASLVSVATPFRVLGPTDPLVQATIARIETDLVHDGGVLRYLADTYYGGGQWVLLAGLLGLHYAEVGRVADARAELAWMSEQATAAGELPEQVATRLLAPERRAEWVERWGEPARPLLWSHAMFLSLALALGVISPEANGIRVGPADGLLDATR